MCRQPSAHIRVMSKNKIAVYMLMLAVIVSGFGTFGSLPAYAATAGTAGNYFDVVRYGAVPNDSSDDYDAFHRALDEARGRDDIVTVHIPAGTYHLSKGLRIWSNTTIKAEPGARIICDMASAGNMLYGVHRHNDGSACTGLSSQFSSCKNGGYTQEHDITIDGGVWDRNCPTSVSAGLLTIIHSQNITIRNATFTGSTFHLLNLSGCANVNIANCTFTDMKKYTGSEKSFWGSTNRGNAAEVKRRYAQLEAVHLDYINAEGESGKYPQDGTPCSNVNISGCTFSNVGAGAGTHNKSGAARGSGLHVSGCTFNNVWGHMANFYSYDNSSLTNCSGTNTAALCRIFDGHNDTVSGVSIDGKDGDIGPSIYVMDHSSGAVLNNISINGRSIGGGVNSLIYIDGGSSVTASSVTLTNGNKGKAAVAVVNSSKLKMTKATIKSPKHAGVYAKKSSLTLLSSKITSPVKNGIYMENCKSGTIKGNTVKSSKTCGIYVTSSKKVTISNNTLSGNKDTGIYVYGSSKKKYSTASILKNTVKQGKSKYAIYLQGYCKSCKVKSNRVGGKGYAAKSKYKVKASGNKKIK